MHFKTVCFNSFVRTIKKGLQTYYCVQKMLAVQKELPPLFWSYNNKQITISTVTQKKF